MMAVGVASPKEHGQAITNTAINIVRAKILGALFNSAGTALFLSASAIFIAQLYGLTITIGQIFAVIG